MNKSDTDFTTVLKLALKNRNNPKDLKAMHIGEVLKLNPLTVGIFENKFLLVENEELYLSEWFRFRCDIDKTGALSSTVPADLDSAKSITETHSYTGSACSMPNAISYLADAISNVNTELLQLKCDLKKGDLVVLGSLEQLDRYVLIDKVLD